MRTKVRLTAVVATCTLLFLNACSSWHVHPLPDADSGGEKLTKDVRLTLGTGETIRVRNVRLTRDSIFGILAGEGDSPTGSPVAVSNSDVRSYAVREPDTWKYVVTIATVIIIANAVIVMMFTGVIR
jgi:hypothetical protein